MRSDKVFDGVRNHEASRANEGFEFDKGSSSSIDNSDRNDSSAINNRSNYSSPQDNRRSNDDSNSLEQRDESWEYLRQLLSTFHHLVDIELPTLLYRINESEVSMDRDHRGQDEISRNYFDIRRCFRNMQELLSREDILSIIDEEDSYHSLEDQAGRNLQTFRRIDNTDPNHDASYSTASNDLSALLKTFANDLVQLSSMSIFDDILDDRWNYGVSGKGIRELHRSLVVLAVNRFPIKAKLNNDQISLLLGRVLSLIEHESQFCRRENSDVQRNQYQRPRHDFEPLQSIISWLNREVTAEVLSQGVLFDYSEAAIALKIPLLFFHEMVTKRRNLLSTSIDDSHSVLTPQMILSTRILIDQLLGALNSLFEREKRGYSNARNGEINISCTDIELSLSQWMSTTQHQVNGESRSGSEHERNDNVSLLRLLDRYAMDLVEETFGLIQLDRQRKLTSQSRTSQRTKYGTERAWDENQDPYDDKEGCNRNGAESNSQKRMTHSTIPNHERVIKVLQYTAMASNVFSIIETNGTSSSGTNGATLVSAGLSRHLWQELARFVVDEVDCLDKNSNNHDTFLHGENDNSAEVEKKTQYLEECRIAATDVLFRLTKIQVQAIFFHNRSNDIGEDYSEMASVNNHLRPSSPLSDEEFSIVVMTILRLLGHPNEYWTEDSQEWVASLLRCNHDPKIQGNTGDVDIGSKLRKVLQATLISSLYVPDILPFEEQYRTNLSLKSLLQPCLTNNEQNTFRKRKHSQDVPMGSTMVCETRKDKCAHLNDPWESFWAKRRPHFEYNKSNRDFGNHT